MLTLTLTTEKLRIFKNNVKPGFKALQSGSPVIHQRLDYLDYVLQKLFKDYTTLINRKQNEKSGQQYPIVAIFVMFSDI